MAIDAGIGLTYDDPHQANWYRQAKAHNMLLVDGSNPDRAQAEGVDVIWTSNDQIDYLAATHHGYDESRGVIHRRHFVFVKPGYFVIYDVVESKRGDHDLSWNLHTTVNLAPDSYNPKSIGPGMLILPSDDSWTSTRSNGIADTHGIRGFPFGHAIIDWLAFNGKVQQSSPTTFAVALYPYPKNVPNVQLKTVTKKDRSSHFSVETPDGIDHLLFGDIDSAGFTLRGAFAHARQKDGKIVSSSASKATQFTYNSQNLLS
jgi:hypothetical protein